VLLSSRESDIPSHCRSKRNQGGLLCSVVSQLSSQLTKRSLENCTKKCYDPNFDESATVPEKYYIIAVRDASQPFHQFRPLPSHYARKLCQFAALLPELFRIPESSRIAAAFPGDRAFYLDKIIPCLLKVT
jgi:hypothetical protein